MGEGGPKELEGVQDGYRVVSNCCIRRSLVNSAKEVLHHIEPNGESLRPFKRGMV